MEQENKQCDVIVVGAGAAGLLCAIEAGKRGRSVLMLERAETVGKKIRISGGGRCNFTNIIVNHDSYLSDNPHFSKSALSIYSPADFISLVEKHGVEYHEKTLGQLFCKGGAQKIISMLLKECATARVEIIVNCETRSITKDGCFVLNTNRGTFESTSLVIATGGLSIPKIGATDFGYSLAKQFGISVTKLKPGLVPFLWNKEDQNHFTQLSGISLPVQVTCGKIHFSESMLFTHKGLSGPAILQISSYWSPGDSISIDTLPGCKIQQLLGEGEKKKNIVSVLSQVLPKRFIQHWLETYYAIKQINQYSSGEIGMIADGLHAWKIFPAGTEGYGKAEVTVGGIDTDELSSKTMESKKVPGLFFIGEVVDVTGHLGGYNFQWAWASGFAAGQYV